jgi:hypothetical protein
MNKEPIFHKIEKKKSVDPIRNHNCRHYEECMTKAAMKNLLLDCGACDYNSDDHFKEE